LLACPHVLTAAPTDELDLEALLTSLEAEGQPAAPGASEPVPALDPASPGAAALGPDDVEAAQLPGATAPQAATVTLEPGEIRSMPVDRITRVAIGDPSVVDVTLVSLKEILLKATAVGTTNLIIWDRQGQHAWNVEVVDKSPEVAEEQLRRLITDLELTGVAIKREEGRIFLTGEVLRDVDLDRINEMTRAYKDVTNLVIVTPPPPPPPVAVTPESVRLTVQLVEMSRNARDEMGVDWTDTVTFTETTFGALGPTGVSQTARLGEAFRLGALTRTGLNSVLNMLASQGKARILAEPKLVASSGKEAIAHLGVEVPVITTSSISSGVVTQSIEFKKTGVELKFQPTVLSDHSTIQLLIDAKVSSIDTTNAITVSGIVVPGFRIRQTKTEISTTSGEAVIIAGLLQDEERKNLSQIPAIGSIPVLGTLFRSTEFTKGLTELILIVTPDLTSQPETTTDKELALEQSLSQAEVAGSVNDPRLRYALQIQERIAKAIRYPQREAAAGLSGRVKLRLHLFKDGTLGQVLVTESSGVEVFDQEALKAAETQSPYPALPSDLIQQDIWLEIPVLFRP
jgi:pilus assembly protein CpaC